MHHGETVDRDDVEACSELLSVHGIKDHYVYEFCAEYRRRIRRLSMPLRCGSHHPVLAIAGHSARAYCRSCINNRLAVYTIEPYFTIPLIYISSESSPLGVSIGAVLFRQDLDIREGVATGRSGRISLCDRRVL